jgi:hypothetical protein
MRTNCATITGFFAVSLLSAVFLSGCTGGAGGNVHVYYLVNPLISAAPVRATGKPLAVEIIDLRIPQYLEKFQIATRSGANRLNYSEYNQWGENLRENLMRTMARNLSVLLATDDVATPINRSSSMPDYRLQIHIEQFELDADGRVKLVARWQLSDSEESSPPGIFSADIGSSERINVNDYEQQVASMQDLFGRLGRLIAETIVRHEADES